MDALAELKAQIAELTRQAEELVRQEKASVIEEVKKKIQDYNLTARELGLDVMTSPLRDRGRLPARAEKPAPEYRDEYGREWSGGRGRKPAWVLQVLESGGDIEQYRILD